LNDPGAMPADRSFWMPACLALKKLAILNLTTLLLVCLDVGRGSSVRDGTFGWCCRTCGVEQPGFPAWRLR
jgi:hypothetical protein